MELANRVAVVTGGSRGIGEAIVRLLFEKGAKVLIADVDGDAALIRAKDIDESGDYIKAVRADVSIYNECENAIDLAVEAFGKVDILVNNAGITKDSLLMRMSQEDWDIVMNVNLKGVFNFTKAVVRPMMKRRYGRIINMASVVGLVGNAGQANYSASKAGVIGFTKTMARELASRNILVNAVAPGFIQTKMTDNLPDKAIKNLSENIPVGALGKSQDVAGAVYFLCSDYAQYITGQVINVDGGMVM